MSLLAIVAAIIRVTFVSRNFGSYDPTWGQRSDRSLVRGGSEHRSLLRFNSSYQTPPPKVVVKSYAIFLRTKYWLPEAGNRSWCQRHNQLPSRTRSSGLRTWKSANPGCIQIQNAIWRGDDVTTTGDSESERGVLDRGRGRGEIRKTVSVTVTDHRDTFLDGDRSSDSSVKSFEHV